MSDVYKTAFTDRLRTRLHAALGACPTCGQTTAAANVKQQTADELGISYVTLWRFLRGDKPSAKVVDSVVDWLDVHERPA